MQLLFKSRVGREKKASCHNILLRTLAEKNIKKEEEEEEEGALDSDNALQLLAVAWK